MAKKDEKTDIEKNLQNEPNQSSIDAETARRLLEGKKAHEEAKKK